MRSDYEVSGGRIRKSRGAFENSISSPLLLPSL